MRNITKLVVLIAIVLLPSALIAQMPDLHKPIPRDKEIRKGVLPNGMTYYIRHNEEPKDRASFYIFQNVGALLENDDQNGLAHFLEHMSFNGTKHFPGKGIINTLEKHGVAFGRNINAYTAFNETVYNLSEVPTTSKGLLDTCLLVLNDWSNYLLLTKEEIDSERGVISEEWRTRRNASFRIRTQTFPALFKGSKWAERDVIGDLNIIKNFKPKTIRDFYHDWYRTDLQAIAMVGDFDVDEMEAKVKELFSKIPAVKNAKHRPDFEIPENKELIFAVATDKEAQQSSVSLYVKHKESKVKDLASLRNSYATSLYNSMLGARVSELLQKGNPPFISASSAYGGFVRGYECYAVSTTAKPNQEDKAFEAILIETERAKRHGFSATELERAKINMQTSIESSYKQKDKISNDSYCKGFKGDFMTNDVCTSSDFDYQFGLFAIKTISLDEINALSKKWLTKENRVGIVTGPSKDAKHLTEQEFKNIIARVDKMEIAPYVDKVSGKALISEDIKGGKVVKTKELKEFSATEWTLSNNVKVIFRHADYDKESVSLSAWSKGGTSLYDNKDIVSASSVGSFIGAYGVGDFDAVSLRKVLAGKKAGMSPSIGGLTEGFSGASTPKDFETMLQLLYLYFEHPRFDNEAHQAMMSRNFAAIKNMKNNPQKAMKDSLSRIFSNYNPRVRLFNEQYLKEVDIKKMEEVYKNRIADASDFTFLIVGNISEEVAKPMIEKYIGSLTDIDREENWVDRKVEGPKGKTVKRLYFPMTTPKSTVIIKYNKKADYNPNNRICQSVISKVLDLRYTENIREKEGGTYGVGVRAGSSHYPNGELSMSINFDCDPDKADHLKELVYKEIDILMKKGPSQKDLDKIIMNIKKNHEQSKAHNSYWSGLLSRLYFHGENGLDPKNFDDIINNLTIKDIKKAARKFFKKADIIDVTILPKK